jgi:glycosyltransferase involved in cell wall biosynthesis
VKPLATPPSFAIVIPAYQAADTVGDAVRSALDQVHPAEEVIVVDDGSTDDLEGALVAFQGDIRLIQKKNGGGASALNAGAAEASSDFVAILDSDDLYHPRRIQALAELAAARPGPRSRHNRRRHGPRRRAGGDVRRVQRLRDHDQRKAILWSCFPGGWPAVRRSRLRAIGGFDERMRIAYDWDCWLRLIMAGSLAGFVDEPYYEYRLRPGSLTSGRQESLWYRVWLLEKAKREPGLSREERRLLRRSIRSHRTRAVYSEMQADLHGRDARYRLARHAFSNVTPRARLDAALGVIAPSLARRAVPSNAPPERRSSR